MRSAIAFILLTRPVNLVIIALTMYALRFGIIYPYVHFQNGFDFELKFGEWDFFLSVLVMVFLAAAGNIINDYFDVKVDRINKPDRVLVGRRVKRRVAMVAHQILNFLACVMGLYLSWKSGLWVLAAIPVFMAASLWYYSLYFKRQLLIGNFVVSLMISFVPLWTGIFEIQALNKEYGLVIPNIGELFHEIWMWLFGYSCFAFILTFSREILKDIEDIQGDAKSHFRTLPIAAGIKVAKYTASSLLVIALCALVDISLSYLSAMEQSTLFIALFLILLILPMLITLASTIIANSASGYRRASSFNKLTMLGGILFCGVVYYTLLVNY